MIILLELIFQGFFEWIYSLILECWNYFSSALLDIMSLDFAYIKTHIPVVTNITEVFLAVGWALLLGNLVFQALRSMVAGLGFEGEDPKLLFARTFVFSFLLLASPQICEIGLNLTSRIMALLEIPNVIDVHLADDSLFGTLSAAWLLVIICDIIIMFKVLKLLLEVAERYVILAVLSITAPLAFSMGGSKSTADIFTGWCRMFGSMCLLMVTNVMFFKMLLSVVSTVPSGLDVFPWMVLIITIVKVAKKADEIITRIGLNPAITGDRGKGMGGILAYTVLRSAASKVVKTAGAALGGAGTAAAGAASAVAGAAGAAGSAGAAGGAGMAGTAGAAGAAFRSGSQRGAAQQAGSPQEQKTDPASQGGGVESARTSQTAQNGGASRKTSVPQGARRATSYVAGTGSTDTAGTSKSSGGKTASDVSGSSGQSSVARTGGFGGGSFGGGGGRGGRRTIQQSGQPGSGASGSGGQSSVGKTSGFGGGSLGGGAGRSPIRHSGQVSGGAGRKRAVDVYVGDDFDDGGLIDTNGEPVASSAQPKGTPAGGAGRKGIVGTSGTMPSPDSTAKKMDTSHIETAGGKVSSAQQAQHTGTRSTRRDRTSTPSGSAAHRTESAGMDGGASTQTTSAQRRQSFSLAQQKQDVTSVSAKVSGQGSAAQSGSAGTEHGTDTQASSSSKRRSPSPARQKQGKAPVGVNVSVKGGGPTASSDGRPVAHPGPAGTGGSTSTQVEFPSKQRSPSPVRQEQGKPAAPAGTAMKGGGPIARPGPAGTVKGQVNQTRTTRAKPGSTDKGGPTHGKPRP